MEAGLSLAPLSLSMFAVAIVAGRKADAHRPSGIIRAGFLLLATGLSVLLPVVPRADSGWALVVPLVGGRLWAGPPGLPVEQLHPRRRSPRNGSARLLGSTRPPARSACRSAWPSPEPSCSPRCRWPSRAWRGQHGAPGGREGAGGQRPRGRRRADEQHPARGAAHRTTGRRPGRDRAHQHRSPATALQVHCRCRSWPPSSGWPTPSGCGAFRSPRPAGTTKGCLSADSAPPADRHRSVGPLPRSASRARATGTATSLPP